MSKPICPKCGSDIVSVERRMDGDCRCMKCRFLWTNNQESDNLPVCPLCDHTMSIVRTFRPNYSWDKTKDVTEMLKPTYYWECNCNDAVLEKLHKEQQYEIHK